jgi:transcriptional regulator with XRE-family HTH domain
MENLGQFLRTYRNDYALTQTDLGLLLGITKVTISNIENNKIRAGSKVIKSISNNLEIELLEVVKLNENNKQI